MSCASGGTGYRVRLFRCPSLTSLHDEKPSKIYPVAILLLPRVTESLNRGLAPAGLPLVGLASVLQMLRGSVLQYEAAFLSQSCAPLRQLSKTLHRKER